jgi:hypothetical protein
VIAKPQSDGAIACGLAIPSLAFSLPSLHTPDRIALAFCIRVSTGGMIMKRWPFFTCLAAFILATALHGADDKAGAKDNMPPEGFTTLFNGKDLTNWKASDKTKQHWKVMDGIFTYDGKEGKNLQTEKNYRHYIVHVDWKINKGGDSGIYLRGKPQIQIWDQPKEGSGGVWNDIDPKTGKRNMPTKIMDKKPGEWNHFEITLEKGDLVTVIFNGEKVVDKFLMKGGGKELPKTGPIELQHHGDPLWFKNIYVKELPDD